MDKPSLSRDAVERVYRLTPLQAGMLFHELESPGASPYHRQVRFEIDGEIDATACEAAWNGLLVRHALLRSVFDWERTAQPLQIVLKQQRVAFEARDADAAAIAGWCAADAARGFDLRRDALIRVALFRLGPARFELVWSHPHILLDGWSGAVLMEEFTALYAAALRGAPAALAAATDPDGFMAEAALRDEATALPHWRTLLAGYDTVATLPRLARGGAPAQMAEQGVRLPAPDSSALRELARRNGATLGVLLQAIWGLILTRWSGRDDVVFGIVTSGRNIATPGIERLVGMFVNTLPVRVQLEDGDTLAALLARLQQQSDAGSAYDHVGLATIQAASALPAGLLDHLLVLENFPAGDTATDTGFQVVATHAAERANYDFGILVHDDAELRVTFQFDASRIDAALMARVATHWQTLVAALLAAPDALLSDIDLLPASERAQLDAAARGPAIARDAAATLVSLWHSQVDRTPDAPALADASVALSFRALDRAAEGVAARLRGDGIVRGDVVGLLCARSAARIVALLGILKAGATYLPLSPALPDARIAMMLADSGCRRVLADAAGLARAEALAPGLAALIARADTLAGADAVERAPSPAAPDDVAYVIYTSGSTGQPKGVAVPHRGFVNMILAQIDGFGVQPGDSVVQFASCTFDASLSEIFMALLAGARLVIAPDAAIRDGAALLALLEAERITVATLPPSYLRALDGASLGPVRVLITAGEPPDSADMRRLARTLAAFNAYGPTEASVCASWHRIDAQAGYAQGIPVGRAIANTAMSIRDRRGRHMPLGAPGEIWLAGDGLARGYVGRPELTAERFPEVGGERFYRTGDTGVLRGDGEVLYAGRIDGQIKLNGHRIELGEVEAMLRALPGVVQAAVAVVQGRLIGFVVAAAPIDGDALRRQLAQLLPGWMVPAAVVPVPELPTTIAGKVDRRALAALYTRQTPAARALTGEEARIADAFAAILGGGPYAPDSGFASSGGDSLRAIRLLARLRREGMGLTLPALLAADSIAAIARLGSGTAAAPASSVAGPVPLTPIQLRHFQSDPDGRARLTHQVLLRMGSAEALEEAVTALWQRHDALRLRFAHSATGWSAEIQPAATPLAWRSVDLRGAGKAALAADAQAHAPGGAGGAAPLFVATQYRLDDGDYLLLAAHHLLVDAMSWRILLEDLADALVGVAPPVSASWRDWAQALPASDVGRERAYWKSIARTPSWPAPEHGYDETEIVTLDLGPMPAGMSERGVLAALLARLGPALADRDDCDEACVTLMSHGRHVPGGTLDLSRTVGWFTAEYPFRLACGASPTAIEAALRDVPSQGVGWSVLRWLATDPLAPAEPAIAVNYLGDVDPAADAPFALSDRLAGVVVTGLRRTRAIEIEAWRNSGRLAAAIRYTPRCDSPAAIRRFAELISSTPAAPSPRVRISQPTEGQHA
ncbi:non-ribosomal peptide synthase protein (TIGR01720 family)/amino acid adenylation domain-containing protein [Tahibacter aquaticus]|uniref:Non-ribosomal peptide synthase protein (TIGR01720 family)/amino acid adenylation domain-containing protein n=1 Tax=Tahibacter aquaticus TaxID=520092 RepID=A0A4R6YUD7_9GAMM|nr:non-ribosomal peptide synthetase [Tahibacter aquaticus]TDR42085.1 non-ribosomal peptide synthase protein (TIGR01720 family)/amino acid adenylation domain-containing protein [Tahibacter aquaticus]